MDRLTSLTVFGKVAELGGFATAARRLGMSPAMVTNHVQELEDRLGVRLLNRTTRHVSLTDAGQLYYEQCSRILVAIEEADHSAAALQQTPTGRLRFNCPHTLAPLVAPVVVDFLARYPDLSIEAIMSDRTVDLIEEGFDLAINMTPAPESQFIVRRLSGYRHVLCASPAYLDERGTPRHPSELVGHNCFRHISYPFGNDWCFEGPDGEVKVTVHGNLVTNNVPLLRSAVTHGQGIVMAPSFVAAEDIAAGLAVTLLDEYIPRRMRFEVVYPNRHRLSAKVRLFIDALIDRLDSTLPVERAA